MADVFISYKTEDRAHAERVASALERSGYSVWWDSRLTPLESWDHTIEREITQARAVVVLWTARSVRSDWVRTEADFGKAERKLIPLCLEPCKIPLAFRLVQAADLTAWDGEVSGEPWQRVVSWLDALKGAAAPRRASGAAHTAAAETRSFSPSIREQMTKVNRAVDALTAGQFEVFRLLGHTKRVRISGCAGSGKTLVACEKAVRLAHAGLRTLFLCHSPHLARFVRALAGTAPLQVMSFAQWLEAILSGARPAADGAWTNYDEPDTATLEAAFDQILRGERFDGIIVDEGQDFREDWWVLVEAALQSPAASLLYIFHDDHQALLPYRSSYPFNDPVLNLSRNCRNAGRIFELVKRFHAQAPEAEVALRSTGHIALFPASPGNERETLRWVLERLSAQGLIVGRTVLLLAGGLEHSGLKSLELETSGAGAEKWQHVVRAYFKKAFTTYDRRGLGVTDAEIPAIMSKLEALSAAPSPTGADVALVAELARAIRVDAESRADPGKGVSRKLALSWRVLDGQLRLRRAAPGPMRSVEVVNFFRSDQWTHGLPAPRTWRLDSEREGNASAASIGVFDIGAFKGLEADTVILLAGRDVPVSDAQLYVALSRARLSLAIVDCGARLNLPKSSDTFHYDLCEPIAQHG